MAIVDHPFHSYGHRRFQFRLRHRSTLKLCLGLLSSSKIVESIGSSLIALTLMWANVSPAEASSAADRRTCLSKNPESAIRACTRLIKSGRQSGYNLSLTYTGRGIAHLNRNRCAKAVKDFTSAIKFNPKNKEAYNYRGRCNHRKSHYELAISDFSEAIRIDPKYASAYFSRANIYKRLGNLDLSASDFYKTISFGNRDAHLKFEAHYQLTIVALEQGRLKNGEKHIRQALAILDKNHHHRNRKLARGLNLLGLIYKRQGRYEDAIPLYKQAIAHLENAEKRNTVSLAASKENAKLQAQVMNNLANIYSQQSRFDDALELVNHAYLLRNFTFGPRHSSVANSLVSLGNAHSKVGNHDRAISEFKKALAIESQKAGEEQYFTLLSIAQTYSLAGRNAEALQFYKRAVEASVGRFGKNHPSSARALNGLAYAQAKAGELESALVQARSAESVFSMLQQRENGGQANLHKPSDKSEHEPAIVSIAYRYILNDSHLSQALTMEAFAAAQRYENTSVSAALTQMAARSGVGNKDLSKLVRTQQDLNTRWHSIDKKLINAFWIPDAGRDENAISKLRLELASVERQVTQLSKQIRTKFPKYGELTNPLPVAAVDARGLLESDEALVTYLVLKNETYVWAITRDAIILRKIDRSRAYLEQKIEHLRKSLDPTALHHVGEPGSTQEQLCRGFEREARENTACKAYSMDLGRAHVLYNLLVGPITPAIAGKRHLIIVPSGPLTGLPFHILVSKASPAGGTLDDRLKVADWMIRHWAISIVPSVTSLRALRHFASKGRANRAFIGIGDPVFLKPREKKATRTRAAKATRGYSTYFRGRLADVDRLSGAIPPLPDTADELREVGRVFQARKSDIILGRKASETTLKNLSANGQLDDFRVVHFATHGLVAGEIKGLAEPALALSIPSKATEIDDGLLTASEVAQLKLNADWVVLSACNTAAGDKPGAEALSGLARAFFYSGSRALLVSHWPVVSEAAVQLTTKTFTSLKADPTMRRAEALRRSMLALIDEGKPYQRHPSYWAPFIVVGAGGKQGN